MNDQPHGEAQCKQEGWDIIAEIEDEEFEGPMKMVRNDEKIEASYENGVKHGTMIYEKMNKYGEKVVYRGKF